MDEDKKSNKERRAFARIERRDLVKVKTYTFPEKGSYEQARIIDLSAGGLQIQSSNYFSPGTVLKIEMNFTGWQRYTHGFLKYFGSAAERPLVVLAEVVRCEVETPGKQYRVAVRFTGIDQNHRQALIKFIKAEILSKK